MQRILHRYQAELKSLAEAAAVATASDRFRLLHRLNMLKKILDLMEEVDLGVEQLLKKTLPTNS